MAIQKPARDKIREYIKQERAHGRKVNYKVLGKTCGVSGTLFGMWMWRGYRYAPPESAMKKLIKRIPDISLGDIYG